METIIYVLVAKNFFTSKEIEYAAPISSQNISLWASFSEALNVLEQAKEQLLESQYYVANSAAQENLYGCQYWVRLEHGNGRAAVLEILRKSVSGVLFTIHHG